MGSSELTGLDYPSWAFKSAPMGLLLASNRQLPFKPEVRVHGKISWVRANSQGSITLGWPLKVLLWAFY